MRKTLKRTSAFLILVCMLVSLMPNFAFAAVDGEVTIDFTTAKITLGSKAGVTPVVQQTTPKEVQGTGFAAIPAETTNKSGRLSARNFTSTMYVDTLATPWLSDGGEMEKWTVSVDLGTTVPGWYDISLKGGKWNAAGAWYIYADEHYAGYYDCYTSTSTSSPTADSAKTELNTLYLTPDENGKIKVMFALAKTNEGYARLILKSMTFTPTTEPDFSTASVDSKVEIPENVTVGTEIPYSASVKMEDGSTRYINGYKADRTVDADNNFGISLISGSGIKVNDGYITPTCAGPMKFVVAAKINGTEIESEPYSFTSEIEVPQEMVLDFTQNVITADDAKVLPRGWHFATNAGYELLLDKSTADRNGQFNHTAIDDISYVKMQTKVSVWPGEATSNSMVTFKKYVGAAGYYKVTLDGAKWYANSQYALYVDGKYAGDYNFYDSSATGNNPTAHAEKTLNTIYLDEGYAEISFRLRKLFYGGAAFLMPMYLTLTPATKPAVSALECELPAEMNKGETEELTVRALMSDGTYRSFGYTDAGTVPTEDIINVTSSNANVVSVENLVQINEDPTTTNFMLSAKNPGTADITVTALVDNTPTVKTVTVNVPYNDDSVAAQENVSYIVRGAKAEFNDGINIAGYTAGKVESHPLNTSFTTKALEEITVGDKKYNFAYWQTAGGAPIENAGSSYTFTPKSNFTLEAVYVPAEPTDTDKKVQFYNFNRVFLGEEAVTDGKISKMPTQPPILAGHTFTGWVAENIGEFDASTEITAALTRVVAQFTADADKYFVKVDGVEVGKYAYGALFETTADETKDNQVFSHWAIGGKVASYERTISFYVWNNVEVRAVYADAAPEIAPVVVLDNIGDEYFIRYEVPTGYTAIDAGIVFGSGTPRIDSTDGSKASVRDIKAKGQFTATPHPDGAHSVARGYVMYKVDATGDIRVIYTK